MNTRKKFTVMKTIFQIEIPCRDHNNEKLQADDRGHGKILSFRRDKNCKFSAKLH